MGGLPASALAEEFGTPLVAYCEQTVLTAAHAYLGAAPGGWSQIAAKRAGAPDKGRVLAIDVLPMAPIAGVEFLHLDFLDAARNIPRR